MTAASITAFLLFLSAFNVDPTTIAQIQAILEPVATSTVAITATTTLQATPDGNATVSTSADQSNNDQQSFGATLPVMEPTDKSGLVVEMTPQDDGQFGGFLFNIQVLDSNGNSVKGAEVTMNPPTPNPPTFPTSDLTRHTSGNSGIWTAQIEYVPNAAGTYTVTFTSGSLTATSTVTAQ